jgi:mannitol-specific phosphotransferase system IIBC component
MAAAVYNPLAPGKTQAIDPGGQVCTHECSKEVPNMKKLLALMFAIALSVSMSSFAFAQAAGGDKMDKTMDKQTDTKDKKTTKKTTKKAKKTTDTKKDDMKKDNMSK